MTIFSKDVIFLKNFKVCHSYSLFNVLALFSILFLFSATFLNMGFSFDIMQHVTWLRAKLFQLLPKVFIRYRKKSASTACILMDTLIFQNQWERGKREEELNEIWKHFLNCIVRIKETAPIFLLMFIYKISKISIDTPLPWTIVSNYMAF